ncbi:MAG: glycosyltransferase family 2 protein [Ruminococcus sp.]|uniref:glycosyltransferase family 2 protein n=1 Tax=Ruminococcus sp. TaxID=41978 RepID=UPI0025E01C83|nr:glycosyltransferase family A protein [Ruminococcus sp.]MCR5539546.1 glycosyltransferase family 2 protein [Ruminococcus sp.]
MPYITIFTPVYNRSHTLNRLYDSIKKQTYRNFEWLVVDDGSSDDSIKKIEEFIENETSFSIRLFKNSHGGKHRAVNTGIRNAKGKLFFMLDSDDWLTSDALEKLVKWDNRIKNREKCAGLCACMVDENGIAVTRGLKKKYEYISYTHMIKNGITGDHVNVVFTDVFKKFQYPEIKNEYHIAPGVPFVRMANKGYKFLFFNEVIYIAEYGSDGLTAMGDKKSLDNFKGYTLRSKLLLNSDVGVKKKIEVIVKYSILAKKKNLSIYEVSKLLHICFILSLCGRLIGNIYIIIKK